MIGWRAALCGCNLRVSSSSTASSAWAASWRSAAVRRAGRAAPGRPGPRRQHGEGPAGRGARPRRVGRRRSEIGCGRARCGDPTARGGRGEGAPSTGTSTRRAPRRNVTTCGGHDLRHGGAVLAAQTGATLAELMARLGHSTPQAALGYQHAAQGRDQSNDYGHSTPSTHLPAPKRTAHPPRPTRQYQKTSPTGYPKAAGAFTGWRRSQPHPGQRPNGYSACEVVRVSSPFDPCYPRVRLCDNDSLD